MSLIYQQLLLKRKEYLEQEILNLQEKITLLPPGKLVCTKNGNYFKWYHSTATSFSYLPKSKQNFAELLALKKYYAFQLEHLKAEIEALTLYLSKFQTSFSSAFEFLNQHPEYQKLLKNAIENVSPLFSKELNDWLSATYETNSMHPEQLSHLSISGHILRSKSEVIIDTALFSNHIPFRYECALPLGSKTFFPDFTIRHPQTKDFFYWEHFGMMDSPPYSQNTFNKLQIYNSHGIIPTINLITTYETKDQPLNSQYVQHLIEHYFL